MELAESDFRDSRMEALQNFQDRRVEVSVQGRRVEVKVGRWN